MNRYQNIPKIKINGNLVYQTSRYPEVQLSVNDIYVYTTQGDRFDILAQQYYKDSSLSSFPFDVSFCSTWKP